MKKIIGTISTQLAIFLDSNIIRPDTLYNRLNEDLGEIIDAMPQTIPLPAEAPADIPRVIGTSSFGTYVLNVSLNRVDIVKNYNPANDMESEVNEFLRTSKNLIISILQTHKVNRLGLVGNHYIPTKDAQQFISKAYLNEKNQGSDEVSLRINKKDTVDGFTLNNILNISQAHIESPVYTGNAVLIQLDYNNDPNHKNLDENTAIKIFNEKSIAYKYSHVMENCKP